MQMDGAAPVFCFYFCKRFFCLTVLVHNPGSAATASTINLIRRVVAQRLVSSFRVVKYKIFRQSKQ